MAKKMAAEKLGPPQLALDAYLQILTTLGNYGANLPVALPYFESGIEEFKKGLADFNEGRLVLTGNQPTAGQVLALGHNPEIDAAEKKVLKLLRTSERDHKFKAIGDGQILALLRSFMTFVQQNPELIQFFISLFTTIAKPTPSTQV